MFTKNIGNDIKENQTFEDLRVHVHLVQENSRQGEDGLNNDSTAL